MQPMLATPTGQVPTGPSWVHEVKWDGMRILAAPVRGDQPIVSGESGAATTGCVANILLREGLHELREKLHLDASSRVLFISTEGDTDRDNYRKVVWDGAYPAE